MSNCLTVRPVAERLQLSEWSIRDAARRGLLPAHRLKPRGQRRFDPGEVTRALKQTGQAGQAGPAA